MGDVLVGNRKGAQFNFTNLGGAGRFRVIPEALWPDNYHDVPMDVSRVGAFEVRVKGDEEKRGREVKREKRAFKAWGGCSESRILPSPISLFPLALARPFPPFSFSSPSGLPLPLPFLPPRSGRCTLR
jgi:hypothetical protein